MRRRLLFSNFDAVLAEVHRLQLGYERTGQWNLTQMAEHLTLATRGSMCGFKTHVAWPKRIIGRGLLPLVLRYGIRDGVRAPAAALPRPHPADDPVIIAAFCQIIEEFRHHTGPLQPHPFFGRLTRAQWERFHLLHAAHHLGFLSPNSP